MMRAYNARKGIGREADTLPSKLMKALIGGESDGLYLSQDEVNQAKEWYYVMAGWDVNTGFPTRAKLDELDLVWVADLLHI
jgi:aldehyde:ferredoxin oxidoreductase